MVSRGSARIWRRSWCVDDGSTDALSPLGLFDEAEGALTIEREVLTNGGYHHKPPHNATTKGWCCQVCFVRVVEPTFFLLISGMTCAKYEGK